MKNDDPRARDLLSQHDELLEMVRRNADLSRTMQTVTNAAALTATAAGASSGLSRSQLGCAYYASSSKG